MARVELRSVSKRFPDGTVAVDDVSLSIADGEFVVLVGPSGCGKSTTLRMIAGLEESSSGEVVIGDRVVNRVPPRSRDVAMVFQNYALYPHMTVERNLAFGLMLRKTPKEEIRRRVEEAARMLGIEPLLKRKPRELSGGQRQRVAVGRAIVRDPACYLFDEPLSNLDVKLRVQMRAELKSLHLRLKTTTVYVTHDQEEAMTLGDRVAVMAAGRLQQVGPPLEVYRRPVNRFVAGFVGMPPMNFVEGRVERDGEGAVFRAGERTTIRLPDPLARTLGREASGPAVLGVRPEGCAPAPEGAALGSEAGVFAATVELAEPLGSAVDVYARLGSGERVLVRADAGFAFERGREVRFRAKPEAMHVFAPGDFGRNVGLSTAPSAAGADAAST